ncbi:uncharacterized protein LOC128741235 isoform X2 [Sabethes cyaneus]|uniref:uncharacterized protein LOC128741235 isoform X2 n=1 Tax=Sabethes cyaneus TaxID=53552 RepID=UPI00237E623B|nr:uncharacterized protein LOC128741235 isoform X2 [Sabethes cyaneus]
MPAMARPTGPVTRHRRMMREIYSEVPDSSAQNVTNFIDTCLYDGTQISRVSIVCDKKPGCRAIQKTGECCPDYQCECQRNGKTYANGEKVFDPETPCRACYCQGGEITCSQVSCYKRHDCEPKFIAGRCCPEYDNCPPLESSKITEASSTKEEFIEVKETEIEAEELLEQNQPNGTSSTSGSVPTPTVAVGENTTPKQPMPPANNNPLGIKIKEITKPEEIRLTDNRPKMSTTTTVAPVNNEDTGRPTTASSVSYGEEANNLEHLDMNVTDDGEEGAKNVRHTDEDMVMNGTAEVTESGESSTAGLSELDTAEGSSDASSLKPTSPTPSTTVRTTGMTENLPESSTKKDNPLPAVVQIGDKLVIVDHNQPKPITVIQVEEVEGLQRGEDDISYDQEIFTDRSPDNRESSKHMKLKGSEEEMLSTQADSSVAYETIYHGGSTENLSSGEVFETQHYTEGPPESSERNDTQLEQLSASSEEFIQMGSSSEKSSGQEQEEHTTVNSLATASGEEGSTTLMDLHVSAVSSEASGDEIYETQFYTEGPASSAEVMDAAASMIVDNLEPTKPTKDLQADDMTTHSKLYIEEDEHDLIQPGFQPIPEDFSLPLRDQPADEMEQQNAPGKSDRKEDVETPKILSEVLEYRKNSTTSTTEASVEVDSEATHSPSWLKEETKQQLRTPGEPYLVPEWERTNGTATSESQFVDESSGAGDFHVLKMTSEEYVDNSEGSGSSSTKKDAEETTLAPAKLLQHDIDASGSGSSESDSVKHNPKNDVESLKYDESDDSTVEDALPKQVKSSV